MKRINSKSTEYNKGLVRDTQEKRQGRKWPVTKPAGRPCPVKLHLKSQG